FAGIPVRAQNQTVLVDRLGSVRRWGTTNTNYYPYGEEQTVTGNGRSKFGTWYRDNTSGFDYAVNRYYSVGRFLTPDPYSGSINVLAPSTFNRYGYAIGDPINAFDPTGLNAADCPPQDGGTGSTFSTTVCGTPFPVPYAGSGIGSGGGGGGGGHGPMQPPGGPEQPPKQPPIQPLPPKKPRWPLDPNSQECQQLAERIANVRRDIEEM